MADIRNNSNDFSAKKNLYEWLCKDFEDSGLRKKDGSSNKAAYAKQLSIAEATMSRFWNEWDKEGVIGDGTWEKLRKYRASRTDMVVIKSRNVVKVFNTCNQAYNMKRCLMIEGEGGYGKSCALEKYKEYGAQQNIKVYSLDVALAGASPKKMVAGLMREIMPYKSGSISQQIQEIKGALKRQSALVILDEVSALKGDHITVLKDLMSALYGVAGLIFAGTPYFMQTVRRSADRNRHLFKELKDRIFMQNVVLERPNYNEAKLFFIQNGLEGNRLKIAMGQTGDPKYAMWAWTNKPTFRGLSDVLLIIKTLNTPGSSKVSLPQSDIL